MKKTLISAAIVATMSVPAFADISIKGDAHFRYAKRDTIDAFKQASIAGDDLNATGQRVRLHFTGKSGDTTLKMGLRNDGGTRVSGGCQGNKCPGAAGTDGKTTGSGAGDGTDANPDKTADDGRSNNTAQLNTDYLFLTTKIGKLNIKAGDWWATTGLGLVRKGVPIREGIVFGTKIGGIGLSFKTVADTSVNFYTIKGKINNFNIVAQMSQNKQALSGDLPVAGTTTKRKVVMDDDYVDLMIKGKLAGVGIAAEFWNGDNYDANVFHVWKTFKGITWHLARAQWDIPKLNKTTWGNSGGSNTKFVPLGISIAGSAPGVNGVLAIADVNSDITGKARTRDSDVVGVRADFKVAGMGVQVAAGNLDLGYTFDNGEKFDDSFKDIIVTRPLGKGSNIKVSYGTYEDASTVGAKVSVKF